MRKFPWKVGRLRFQRFRRTLCGTQRGMKGRDACRPLWHVCGFSVLGPSLLSPEFGCHLPFRGPQSSEGLGSGPADSGSPGDPPPCCPKPWSPGGNVQKELDPLGLQRLWPSPEPGIYRRRALCVSSRRVRLRDGDARAQNEGLTLCSTQPARGGSRGQRGLASCAGRSHCSGVRRDLGGPSCAAGAGRRRPAAL